MDKRKHDLALSLLQLRRLPPSKPLEILPARSLPLSLTSLLIRPGKICKDERSFSHVLRFEDVFPGVEGRWGKCNFIV